jgi:hypothetical protein
MSERAAPLVFRAARRARALEKLVWEPAGGRCEYCQVAQVNDPLPFEIDHIIAKKTRRANASEQPVFGLFRGQPQRAERHGH